MFVHSNWILKWCSSGEKLLLAKFCSISVGTEDDQETTVR